MADPHLSPPSMWIYNSNPFISIPLNRALFLGPQFFPLPCFIVFWTATHIHSLPLSLFKPTHFNPLNSALSCVHPQMLSLHHLYHISQALGSVRANLRSGRTIMISEGVDPHTSFLCWSCVTHFFSDDQLKSWKAWTECFLPLLLECRTIEAWFLCETAAMFKSFQCNLKNCNLQFTILWKGRVDLLNCPLDRTWT